MRFLEWLQLTGKILHGNNDLWSMMKKSSVSRMQRLCTLRFCVMPWKGAPEPIIKYFRWGQVDVAQEFITILNFVHNWWWANGIRVEYVPRVHHIAAHQQSPRVHDQSGDPSQFKGRIIFMSMFNDIISGNKDNEREYNANDTLVSIFAKRFSPGRWSFLGPGSEKQWYSTYKERPQGEWDRVAELMIKFSESKHPVFRATSPLFEERSIAKEVENYLFTSVPMGIRLKLFFAQFFLLISSIFTEQSQICVTNANPAMLEQGDLFWWDNLTHCLCSQVWWKHLHLWLMILRKKIYCKSTKNKWTSYHNQNRVIKFCTDAGFLTTVDVGQYFMTKDTEEFSQFTEPVTCREYTLPRDEKSSYPKGWIRGNTKIGPVLEVTTATCKVNMEWKSELDLWTKTILTRGSEFLMAWISWSRTWSTTKSSTTTSRRPLRRSRTNSRWKRLYLLLQADQRLKQNHEDLLLLAHLQELHPSGKESGLMLSQELIRISLSQCEKEWLLFFVMVLYFEKKMERLNSGD